MQRLPVAAAVLLLTLTLRARAMLPAALATATVSAGTRSTGTGAPRLEAAAPAGRTADSSDSDAPTAMTVGLAGAPGVGEAFLARKDARRRRRAELAARTVNAARQAPVCGAAACVPQWGATGSPSHITAIRSIARGYGGMDKLSCTTHGSQLAGALTRGAGAAQNLVYELHTLAEEVQRAPLGRRRALAREQPRNLNRSLHELSS